MFDALSSTYTNIISTITIIGFKEEDMKEIAELINLVATDFENKADEIRAGVTEICKKFPLYE